MSFFVRSTNKTSRKVVFVGRKTSSVAKTLWLFALLFSPITIFGQLDVATLQNEYNEIYEYATRSNIDSNTFYSLDENENSSDEHDIMRAGLFGGPNSLRRNPGIPITDSSPLFSAQLGPFGNGVNSTNPINAANHDAACAVRAVNFVWFDNSRSRTVPAKIYYPANAKKPLPIIIFSHGLGGSKENCAYLAEYWAVNGYISVHIQHAGSDENTWKGKLRPLNEMRIAYESNWTARSRVLDIQFVLTKLETLKNANRSFLAQILDTDSVGVAGYDLGAYASMIMAGQLAPEGYEPIFDPRIKAVLAMGPPVVPTNATVESVYAQIELPCMFITGTRDDGIIGNTKAAERRIPYDNIGCNDQYLVVFDGTDHLVYAGHFLQINAKNDAPYQHTIARLSTNFWNAYLKNNQDALAFMMSNNAVSLLNGLGQMERKFYIRENQPFSNDTAIADTNSDKNYGSRNSLPLPLPKNQPYISSAPDAVFVPATPIQPYSEQRRTPRILRNSNGQQMNQPIRLQNSDKL
ncbi:MAG: alpha/beta hydrolase family protein [Thermoguttaceae bacterium]